MVIARSPGKLSRVAATAGLAGLVACGGAQLDAPDAAATRADAAALSSRDAGPGPADASSDDATVDASGGCAPCGEDAADDADAAAALNLPDATDLTPTATEVCHVTWPQAGGLQITSQYMQLAVDAEGNAYLAVSYSSPLESDSGVLANPDPPIGLGDASPAYPTGIAIAKVDTACNLVWMRELGAASSSSTTSIQSVAVAVDGDSSVVVLGNFTGSVDLGAGLVDAPPILDDGGDAAAIPPGVFSVYDETFDAFLVRLDAAGNVVFSKVFKASDNWFLGDCLAVTPSGVTTVLARGVGAPDFGDGPLDGGTDTSSPGWHGYLAQFDSTGRALLEETLPASTPSYTQLTSDPLGNLWTYGYAGNDAGTTNPSLMRLTASGDLAWSQPGLAGNSTFAVYGSGEVVFAWAQAGNFPVGETLQTYLADGGVTSTRTTFVSYAGSSFAQQMVADTNGNAIVAGEFAGTFYTHADGSFTEINTPEGVGFQLFDATGNLRSVGVWGDSTSRFGAVGVDPVSGQVILLGSTAGTAFLVRLAR